MVRVETSGREVEPVAPMSGLQVNLNGKTFAGVGRAPAHHALAPIRFSVERGQLVCVTGPSGCGKTTLLNVLAGLDRDYNGEIHLPRQSDHKQPSVGYVFQTPRLLPWRTVEQNLALVKKQSTDLADINELLALTGLADFRHTYPQRLSTGMQRRVALARAFVVRPDLLLMDEPFVSLDETNAARLRLLLLDIWRRYATTVIFVSHDLREAVQLGQRIIRLSPAPGQIDLDLPISLSQEERSDAQTIEQWRNRILESN